MACRRMRIWFRSLPRPRAEGLPGRARTMLPTACGDGWPTREGTASSTATARTRARHVLRLLHETPGWKVQYTARSVQRAPCACQATHWHPTPSAAGSVEGRIHDVNMTSLMDTRARRVAVGVVQDVG